MHQWSAINAHHAWHCSWTLFSKIVAWSKKSVTHFAIKSSILMCQYHWAKATLKTERICLRCTQKIAEMWMNETRRWGLMLFVIVATLLCDLKTAVATETAIEQPRRRALEQANEQENVVMRGLMPIRDDYYSNSGDDEYRCMLCLTNAWGYWDYYWNVLLDKRTFWRWHRWEEL